jgi:hypothetical protein
MAIEGGGRPLTAEQLEEWVKPDATTRERIQLLLGVGVYAPELAETCDVSVSALRSWGNGSSRPRREAAVMLDRLRVIASLLIDSGMEPERIGHWLRAYDPDLNTTPLERLRESSMDVINTAAALARKRELAGV